VRESGSVKSGRDGLRRRARERKGTSYLILGCIFPLTGSGAQVYIHVLDT